MGNFGGTQRAKGKREGLPGRPLKGVILCFWGLPRGVEPSREKEGCPKRVSSKEQGAHQVGRERWPGVGSSLSEGGGGAAEDKFLLTQKQVLG